MMRDNLLANAPRMSLSALNMMEDKDRQVRIWLLGSTTVKGTVFYRVAGRFNASNQTWQVNRRYSEFLVLRDTLVKYFSRTTDTCPGCLNYLHAIKQFDFPKKHLFVSRSQLVVNYRIQALRSFMNLLASWAFSNSPKCPTCGGFAFDIVRNFCLESAEAVGDSSMSSIRDSFVVSTFTDAGRRSSLTRHSSMIPASGSHTLNAQRRDQQQRQSDLQHRSTAAGGHADKPRARRDEDAYEAFNDYLGSEPTQLTKTLQSRSAINIRQPSHDENEPEYPNSNGGSSRGSRAKPPHRTSSGGGNGRTPQPSAASGDTQTPSMTNGSFLFYQDGVESGHSAVSSQRASTTSGPTNTGSQRSMPPSSGSKRGILKNWNDVRHDRAQNGSQSSQDYDAPSSGRGTRKNTRDDARSENDSYFSLGRSSGHSREDENGARPSSQRGQRAPPSRPQYRENERQPPYQQQRDGRYDRSQNDSYLSLGASSTSGDLEEEYDTRRPYGPPSPIGRDAMYGQPPPPMRKSVSGQQVRSPPSMERLSQRHSHQDVRSPPPSSQRKSQRHRSPPPPPPRHEEDDDEEPRSSRRHRPPPQPSHQPSQRKPPVVSNDSFATDSFVDESLRFDGMDLIAVDDVSDSDDDEIDITGLAIDTRTQPRKSTSGEGLWQPWELAKAG